MNNTPEQAPRYIPAAGREFRDFLAEQQAAEQALAEAATDIRRRYNHELPLLLDQLREETLSLCGLAAVIQFDGFKSKFPPGKEREIPAGRYNIGRLTATDDPPRERRRIILLYPVAQEGIQTYGAIFGGLRILTAGQLAKAREQAGQPRQDPLF